MIPMSNTVAAACAAVILGVSIPSVKAEPQLNPFSKRLDGLSNRDANRPALRIGTLPGCLPNVPGCTYVYPNFSWALSGYTTLVINGRPRR